MTDVVTGDMFSIAVDGVRATVRIWRRPDIDSARGAENAEQIQREGSRLHARGVRAVLVDVRDAPAVAGPKSSEAMAAMLAAWEKARMKVAVLVGDDALKALQWKRLVTEKAPHGGRVSTDPALADEWLSEPSTGSR